MNGRLIGVVWGILCAGAATAQQVTFSLPEYEALRARANPTPEVVAPPAAPWALESLDLKIEAGPASARVSQTLVLTLYGSGWQTIPLGDLGAFTGAALGALEGRVEAPEKGAAVLKVRGAGRHAVRLESVVSLVRDEEATRPTWRLSLAPPPCAPGSLPRPASRAWSSPAPVSCSRRASAPGTSWPPRERR